MFTAYDHLTRILSNATSAEQRLSAMRGFASDLHWTPSFEMHHSFGVPGAENHLVVEHGLENSAIISFIKAPRRTTDLDPLQLRLLLEISFNNLIEWHIFVSETEVRYVNNLTEPFFDRIYTLSRTTTELASAQQFEKLTTTDFANERYARSLQACDDILIKIISHWKRLLTTDYRSLNNEDISALFNWIIFARACEDQQRMQRDLAPRLLLRALDVPSGANVSISDCIMSALNACGVDAPTNLLDFDRLTRLPAIDRLTLQLLLGDFYRPSFSAYDFNFALMSKHALSRIYERYVALLEFDDDDRQLSFIPQLPTERFSPRSGAIYTPLFVASFFARFLRDNVTPKTFRNMTTIDPACGSGIFLRTLLELQCNPLVPGTTPQTISTAFENTYGIDRDDNACQATRLSLALLHLVATGTLPQSVNVERANAIELALSNELPIQTVGAAIANPPYIKLDHLPATERHRFIQYLGEHFSGRTDSYLAFVKLCLELVQEDGFACLVLPQVFLLAKNAAPLRQKISNEFDIRCLVDLSSMSVFEHVGAYSILLILQKRGAGATARSIAHIARIQGSVGPALQAVLEGRTTETDYYNTFDVDQAFFDRAEWTLLSAPEISLERKLAQLRPISWFLDVHQGFITGADDIFIRPKDVVSRDETSIYVNYLPDRNIGKFRIPRKADEAVFYPFEDGKPINEAKLRKGYPKTWKYLSDHRNRLTKRKSIARADSPWWRPLWPRDPNHILRPKIVCPHLMLTPRFAVDLRGSYAVSRSPFLIQKEAENDLEFLKFFCAVLNSSVAHWFINSHAPKYSRGYNRIEVALLKKVPVPDPSQIKPGTLKEIVGLFDQISSREDSDLEVKAR